MEPSQIRFDSPRSHVYTLSEKGLRWHSVSCGYRSGLLLDVDGDAEFTIGVDMSLITMAAYGGFGDESPKRVSYGPRDSLRLTVSMADLATGPKVLDIGPLNRKLTVELAPESTVREAEFSVTDPDARPGINPYWLRVVQTDMEMAWTSPVFVDYAG